MSITSETATRENNTTTVVVTSDLSAPVYFFWYVYGAYVGRTTVGRNGFALEQADQVRISVLDSNDPDFDAIANAPDGFPARRTLVWNRSIDADVAHYRIEQQREAEGYTEIGIVNADDTTWQYHYLTPRLDDLTNYDWKITPVDSLGVDGTPVAIGPELIVRNPDAVEFTVTAEYDGVGTKITFDEAA